MSHLPCLKFRSSYFPFRRKGESILFRSSDGRDSSTFLPLLVFSYCHRRYSRRPQAVELGDSEDMYLAGGEFMGSDLLSIAQRRSPDHILEILIVRTWIERKKRTFIVPKLGGDGIHMCDENSSKSVTIHLQTPSYDN